MNLHGVDISTFTPIAGSFAKDKSHVYYWHNTINGADVKSFKVIDAENAYSRDQSYLYSGHLKVDQVDPDTFQYLDSGIIKDNKAVYSLSKSKDAIKITTIHTVDFKTLVALGWSYFKDINTVFVVTFDGTLRTIPGADVNSFQVLKSDWAKDKSFVYLDGKKMDGINPSGFTPPDSQ